MLTLIFILSKHATAKDISIEIPYSITYNYDGSYDIETSYSEISEHNLLLSTTAGTETKSFSKRLKHYDKNNNLCWCYTLTATFTVNKGVSAKYKSSSASLDITNKNYSLFSEHHNGTNNIATGTIKINYKGKTSSNTTTITCTKYGNFI